MENKKSFLIILVLVVSTHIYLFAQLKMEEQKTVIAPKPTNKSVQIKLNKVVIKKQEIKPEPKIEEIKKVVKKEIIKKKLIKTKSKNIIKKEKKHYKKKVIKKKVVKKKLIKKVVKKTPVEKPKKVFKEVVKQQMPTVKVEEKSKEVNKKVLNSVKNNYLSKLQRLIEKNKKYPKSAKRLKQMGKVYLSFTIAKNGEIRNVKISKNSKYKRLNKATREIMSNIKKFDPIPKELNKSSWAITVPVVYQIVRN
ncbi:energy transducer TonB [Poseidonibacter ostreae]|uniref:TonB family protein n=1 Tax=Poseidonibacter ostreae TaxID=2654171 RepID=A0A6L4WRG9_9BACT|nr:energy transducer TonB [Poseidonibacter ostreae]KAB7888160.1 TonB family protein [Poseidonibacter ostreae]KAB7892064.1 TonB family protein [Poseidonibacter ostreae]|tara:strand:+ start:7617 stop:8369 length:753 start_codon:yes stop_codon:yes gene_type:complete